jgi:mono/diheme cytochrome c family protein
MKYFILFCLLTACANINRESREYYHGKKNVYKHEIKPAVVSADTKRMVYEKNPSIKKINRGKELYKVACYDCHGPKGHGDGPLAKDLNPKPVNLKRLVKEAPHFTLHLSISQWSGKMPGWKNKSLNEKDIRDISLYLRSLHR